MEAVARVGAPGCKDAMSLSFFYEKDAGKTMAVTLDLEFADSGWHMRWRCSSSTEWHATTERFKETLGFRDRYWDELAFEGKGGWWVRYGALEEVGHLFANYREKRKEKEEKYWSDYWREQQEARERFAREQVRESQQRAERKQQKQRKQRTGRQQKQTEHQQKPPRHEEVRLPNSLEEALAILHVSRPTTLDAIKRAFRAEARKFHPDVGGSNEAMIRINTAYEMAKKSMGGS